jgi:hypothetical protein
MAAASVSSTSSKAVSFAELTSNQQEEVIAKETALLTPAQRNLVLAEQHLFQMRGLFFLSSIPKEATAAAIEGLWQQYLVQLETNANSATNPKQKTIFTFVATHLKSSQYNPQKFLAKSTYSYENFSQLKSKLETVITELETYIAGDQSAPCKYKSTAQLMLEINFANDQKYKT